MCSQLLLQRALSMSCTVEIAPVSDKAHIPPCQSLERTIPVSGMCDLPCEDAATGQKQLS